MRTEGVRTFGVGLILATLFCVMCWQKVDGIVTIIIGMTALRILRYSLLRWSVVWHDTSIVEDDYDTWLRDQPIVRMIVQGAVVVIAAILILVAVYYAPAVGFGFVFACQMVFFILLVIVILKSWWVGISMFVAVPESFVMRWLINNGMDREDASQLTRIGVWLVFIMAFTVVCLFSQLPIWMTTTLGVVVACLIRMFVEAKYEYISFNFEVFETGVIIAFAAQFFLFVLRLYYPEISTFLTVVTWLEVLFAAGVVVSSYRMYKQYHNQNLRVH